MPSVCFYFQVHQPFRMRHYSIFDIGKSSSYFDYEKNKETMQKVANKCYLPMNRLLLNLINKYKKEKKKFKIAFSISGIALDQFEEFAPEVLHSFKELAKTGCVEFLSETYYHSLSYLYSKEEFKEQVKKHKKRIWGLFRQKPKVFRNTELIFNNDMAKFIEKMGYKAILAEGADHVLGWRSPNHIYKNVYAKKIKILLKNYKLSDDIAFRFGNKGWEEHPLTADKFAKWISASDGETVNLFMDYETFGEHQWEDTGIFAFMEYLPQELFKHGNVDFVFPSELANKKAVGEVDVHDMVSWADIERDLSAWLGNKMQNNAISDLYKLEQHIKRSKDKSLMEDWRKLTTSDHYYYMCTKWFADGDVHKYFNPYDSPYDAFMSFMNILNDLILRLKAKRIMV